MAQVECATIVRFLNILCAITLIGIAVYRFLTLTSLSFMIFIYTAYWMYVVLAIHHRLFGVMILASEFTVQFFLKYFRFLDGACGKGLFLVLYWLINIK